MSRKIPSYRLHKASGQAVVVLAGKSHYLGTFGSKTSRKAYDKVIAEWLARSRQAEEPSARSSITVTELIAAFWRHARDYYRGPDGEPTGELSPLRSALRILRQSYGSLSAADFTPLKLQATRERMIAVGWARTTINRQVRRLIHVFRWGVSQELVASQVPAALREVAGLEKGRTAAREPEPIRPIDDVTFERTLPYLQPTVADLLRLMRRTGMRPEEACSIRPADVDQTGDVWVYTPRQHKTGHHGIDRLIPIGPVGQSILAPYLKRGANEFCFSPAESLERYREAVHAARKTPLHHGNSRGKNRKRRPRNVGDRYDATAIKKAIQRACEIAFGMPRELRIISKSVKEPERTRLKRLAREWRREHCWGGSNRLRHAFATEIRKSHGLEAAQVLLGHTTADMTEVYALANQSKAISVAREVG